MKQYVIRSIGWVFDDDWYNYDGEHDIVGCYSYKAEDDEKCKILNHQYFFDYFPVRRKFQLNYCFKPAYKFLDTEKIIEFLANYLGLDKEKLAKQLDRIDNNLEIKQSISPEIIEQILNEHHFTFFKIV
ncbi:MAG: hypothetical protein AB8G22_13445, partial [Saprospiraceae bacterium]